MSCPTCSHTMHNLGRLTTEDFVFHCPRCGTVRLDGHREDEDTVVTPKTAAIFKILRNEEFMDSLESALSCEPVVSISEQKKIQDCASIVKTHIRSLQ